MASILIIDDNETVREGMAAVAAKLGHKTFVAAGGAEGIKLLSRRRMDFVITDLKMEGVDGLGVLQAALEKDEDTVVMLVTGFGTVETAVEAMKRGAFDFITKPFGPEVLRAKIQQALEVAQTRRERRRLQGENEMLRAETAPPEAAAMVGTSRPMQQVLETVRKVAASDSTVLLTGESGTGKEVVARALHQHSRRADRPFIRVNCGALAETLLESELFGYEKGAFTGAQRRKLGRFELADGGTLLLDEIGEVGPALQLKLLRVLQEREFERVGGEETIAVDVRLIAATNQDLLSLVREGRFREDLYYRLAVVPIRLPPLRERPEDIESLARHFLEKLRARTGKTIQDLLPETLERLRGYRWPGNVRELENVIEQAMVFAEGEVLRACDLPANLREGPQAEAECLRVRPDGSLLVQPRGRSLDQVLEEIEKHLILQAYQRSGQVKTECARLLGIKTPALYYKLEKYGIIEKGAEKKEQTEI
ncbi:MAG: sigma-54-dependent Fis family transcriptional regulator [Myxococcales bacterium]|nr:sigma-54-dependent Fis family transcriptional regulator [Myxococcales bacterium]